MSYDKELIVHKLLRWERYLNNYRLPAWKEIPDIGLYMDQVIALLGQYLDFIPVEDQKDDKPVAPTTINNYVRLKVMPAPEKRKYYRIHIAYLIMIFTLKQGTSIRGIQRLLPDASSETEVREFYTNYVELVQYVGNIFTAQTRSAVKDFLEPQTNEDMITDHLIIQGILISGFARIMGEKLLRLQNADTRQVLEQEKLNDARGLHPLMPHQWEEE